MKSRMFVLMALLAALITVALSAPYRARSSALERGIDEVLVGLQDLHPGAYAEHQPHAAPARPIHHDVPDTGLVEH